MKRTAAQINLRLNNEEFDTFTAIEAKTGTNLQAITHALYFALIQHWKKNGTITLPFQIADSSERHEVTASTGDGGVSAKATKHKT